MHNVEDLLHLYENYKNKVDAFHHARNKYETRIDTYNALAELRRTIEKTLPEIAVKANSISNDEFEILFSINQTLYIDDYNYRLGISELILNPTTEQIEKLNAFKATVSIT